jgi:hypothetical protein
MSFTSIRTLINSPRHNWRGSLFFLSGITSEKNRQLSEIRSVMVGNQTDRRFAPGVFVGAGKISRGVEEYPEAQISFTMNNDTLPNGQLLKIGNNSTPEPTNPNQNPDFLQPGNDALLHIPRVPELDTNDEQSLRTWLKANIPNQSAPPSLLERLKNIPHKE